MQARVPSSISVPNLKRRTLFVHQLLGGQKFRNWVMWRRPRPFRGSFYIPFVVVVRYYVRSVPRRQSSGQSSRAEFGRSVVAPVRPLRRAFILSTSDCICQPLTGRPFVVVVVFRKTVIHLGVVKEETLSWICPFNLLHTTYVIKYEYEWAQNVALASALRANAGKTLFFQFQVTDV